MLALRLCVSLTAAAIALLSLGERAPNKIQTRFIFFAIIFIELLCGILGGKLSLAMLLLFAVAAAAILNLKRDQRLIFQSLGRGLKPTARRQLDLVHEPRGLHERVGRRRAHEA